MPETKKKITKQQAEALKALKGTIMTPDGQVVQITTKPAPTPKGVPDPVVDAKTRKRHKQALNAFLNTDDVVKEQVGGFVNFIREKAVVGLAVGFVVGTQAQTVVKQLVTSFIDPLIQLFFGGAKLSDRMITLSLFGNTAAFAWGAMIYALLNLLVVLLAIYILIKALKLDKLDKPTNS
jgi:large conductance mechanosensitive channel protein